MSIILNNVSFTYMKGSPFEKQALKDVTLRIDKGEFVAVIGHTGSGKSTLVQHLAGLLQPTVGSVSVDDVLLSEKKNKEAKQARNKVGMVFQYPEQQIFAETVYDDIAFGPRNKGMNPDEVDKQVRAAMDFVSLDFERFAHRSPFVLSGGQMRRVAIAGVVAMAPDYLILDEPSAGLDPRSRDAIFDEIMRLHEKLKIAVILVTHSMEEAAKYASRLLVVSEGKIILDGVPQEIYDNHREELLQVSMDVPQIYKLTAALRESGLDVKDTLDADYLVRSILKLRRKEEC